MGLREGCDDGDGGGGDRVDGVKPGTRPIGIGEAARRICGKAIMSVVKRDVEEACGATQMCGGQKAGIEAVIHAMTDIFHADESDAILLIDAENAFNCLNRAVALQSLPCGGPPLRSRTRRGGLGAGILRGNHAGVSACDGDVRSGDDAPD